MLRKAILVNGAAMVGLVAGLGQSIILARVLGPGGVGQYSIIIATAVLMTQLVSLGLPTSLLYHTKTDPQHSVHYLMNTIWVSLGLGALGGLALAALIFFREGYFGTVAPFVLVALALYVPLVLQGQSARMTLMVAIEARRLSIITLTMTVGVMSLIVVCWAVGVLSTDTAVVCFTAGCLGHIALGGYWLRRKPDFRIAPEWTVIKRLVFMGVRQSWADLMILVNAQLNILIVNYLIHDFDMVGYYSRGQRVALLVVAAGQATLPMLFSRWAAIDRETLHRHVEQTMRFATTVGVVGVAAMLVFGRTIIVVLYGREFLPAVTPFRILAPGAALYLLSRVLIKLLGSQGRPEAGALVLAAINAVNLGVTWWLVPRLGIAGAALGSTVAQLALFAALSVTVCRLYGIRFLHCLIMRPSDYKVAYQALSRRKDVGG